jgi:hypothetical protein
LELQGNSPAYVMDRKLNVVGWNKAAALIYGDYASMSERERNSLWRTFASPYVRRMLREHWESHARHRLATFRSHYANDPGDSWWTSMIEELNAVSREFRAWWPQHDVLSGPEGKKINHHPLAGRLVFDQLSFIVSDAPHLTMTINVPDSDTDTASRVENLLLGKLQPGEH